MIRSIIISLERSPKKLLKSLILSPSSNHTPLQNPSDFDSLRTVTMNPNPPPRKMQSGKGKGKKGGPSQEREVEAKEKEGSEGRGELELEEGILPERSLDLFSIVNSLCKGSGGSIQEEDFLPGSVLRVAEPLLEMLGAGSYAFDPHDFCGVVVPLLNTPESSFVPFSRHFDCLKFFFFFFLLFPLLSLLTHKYRFFQKIQPLLPELRPDNLVCSALFFLFSIRMKSHHSFFQGFFSALKLKSIANECGVSLFIYILFFVLFLILK